MSVIEKQCCGNCKHWEYRVNVESGRLGKCYYFDEVKVQTPFFVSSTVTLENSGWDCPAFSAKPKE